MAASVRFFVVATAWRICMKRGSTSRSPGWLATRRDSGWRIPATASSPCSRKTSNPSAPRTTWACVKVRLRNRSYADPSFTPTRTPGRSTSAAVVIGDPSGTA